jgi:hypothetical protein
MKLKCKLNSLLLCRISLYSNKVLSIIDFGTMTSMVIETKVTEEFFEEKVDTVQNISSKKFNNSKLDINKSYDAEDLVDYGLVQINSRFIDFRSCDDYIITFVRRDGVYEFSGYYQKSESFNGNERYSY